MLNAACKICFSFIVLFIVNKTQAQRSDLTPLGNIRKDGLPLAQIFDSRVTDPSVYTQNANKVFFVWGSGSPQLPGGVLTSKYFPSIRNPNKAWDINWYKANHPDWIMYQADKVTPAYGFIYSYGGLTPLDVSNPEVRAFYMKEFILPAVNSGYKMVAMDNVDLGNSPKAVGHYKGGEWVPLYTGKRNDTAFQNNMIAWMQFLSEKLHPLNVKVAANIKEMSASHDVVMKMINSVDVFIDENGFTHTGVKTSGTTWDKQHAVVQEATLNKGYVSINQVDGTVDNAPEDQIEWTIANFLLSRGPQSLLAIVGFENNKAITQEFHYRPEMNVNIGVPIDKAQNAKKAWVRSYTKGLVCVNPTKDTIEINLPEGKKYRSLTGEEKSGKLKIGPASGYVLANE